LRQPPDATQLAAVATFEGVLYVGFRQAVDQTVTKREALFIGNDRYGAATLSHALEHGYLTALSLEDSELELDQRDLAQTLERWRTMFGKVRLQFDADGDVEENARVLDRLRRLLIELRSRDRLMMIELTTPPEALLRAIEALQDGGADPDVWIVPPLGRSDAELVSALVRREGRHDVSCLVRGHGGDAARVREELQQAAMVPGYVGFSTNADDFFDIARACRANDASFTDLATRVAERYGECIECFRSARVTFEASTGEPFFQP
jgi:myo-inositol catabolism protein IolC